METKISRTTKAARLFINVFCAVAITGLLVWATTSAVIAQTSQTTVSGIVKDQNDALVPGVAVKLTDMATKAERNTTTNDQGFYLFSNVLAGTYTVYAELGGFKKTLVPNVKVDVSIPATVNITLETGQISETVTTTAGDAQAVINTENAELSTVVMEKQINDLPLNGRNPVQLASLQAGVATNTGSTRDSNINGMRGSYNNITWDGVNVMENYLRGSQSSGLFAQAAPSVSGVGEFTIVTQNASAADGTGAAQVKLVTPRGSSQYHGSLFEYARNSAFNANTFLNNAAGIKKPYLNQHQFGGTVGGPFALPRLGEGAPKLTQKGKLFFYFYYEMTKEGSQDLKTRTVLDNPARTGNFTYNVTCTASGATACPPGISPGSRRTVNVLGLAPGRLIDPRIQRLIDQTPLPNDRSAAVGDRINTFGYSFNTPSGSDDKLLGYRINYDRSQKHRFDIVYSKDMFDFPNDTFNDTGEPFPGLPGKGQFPRRSHGAAAWNWAPTSTLTNEFRAGYYEQKSIFIGPEIEYEGGVRLSLPTSPTTLMTNPVQNSLTSGRNGHIKDVIDNVSWTKGNHLIRFGGNYRNVHVEPFSFTGTIPQYTVAFGNNNTNPLSTSQFPGGIGSTEFNNASNLLALLTGAVSAGSQTFNVTSATSGFVKGAEQRRNLIYDDYSAYVTDTWRMTPHFTLNLGMRYEYITPTRESAGIGLMPVGGLEVLGNQNVQIDVAGGGNGTRPFYKSDKNNFAPNFSFSWDPFKEGKTAIRGGYSISYVIDSLINMTENAVLDGNQGLTATSAPNNLSGTVSGGGIVPIATPAYKVPRTLDDQLTLNQFPTLFTIQPNLTTPYVQQWNFGIEREIMRNTAVEVRYVGNRGTSLLRGIDLNQVHIFDNGFLQDFQRAQANLALTGNPACTSAGCQPLTVFPRIGRRGLFTTATGSTLNSDIVNLISQGQVGELAFFYLNARNTYLTPGAQGNPTTNGLTSGFFTPFNPKAGAVDYIGNGSWSTYNGLQAEIRRRLSNGLYFQANYTFSKGFTDFEGSSSDFSGLLDLERGGAVEKKRSPNDITHLFKANGVWELPFGPGKEFLNHGGVMGTLLGGWQINGIFENRTGRPISLVSARGTLNRSARSAKNTANTTLSPSELKNMVGKFHDPATGRPLVFDPKFIGADGRANPAYFQHPAAGTLGNLQLTPISGPGYWNFDFGLIKRTKISEHTNIELRAEFFNVLNHTNFTVPENQNINSTSFGRPGVNDFFDPRIIQFAAKFNF